MAWHDMTLREIDDSLATWNSRLGAAAQNLVDLLAEPTYLLLTGSDGAKQAPITGATAHRVEPALGAMVNIFQHFELLKHTIERAAALRRNLPLFGSEQKMREIQDLLDGKSIHLPPVDVPLEQRTLLSAVQNVECISPGDLLDTMVKAFQNAKDTVITVGKAWKDLEQTLGRNQARIISLRARAGIIGPDLLAELSSTEQALQDLRARVMADPLGASADFDSQIEPALTRIEALVDARERLQREIPAGLAAARSRIDTLAGLQRDTVAAATEARQKITGCATLPAPLADDKLEGLRQWLARLETKYAEGILDPVAIGLRNWNSAAEDCIAKERAALSANRAPLETRNELRGRLDALKAKARAYGVAEESPLLELARQAEALLYRWPTALEQAARAVADYERALSGETGKGGTASQ